MLQVFLSEKIRGRANVMTWKCKSLKMISKRYDILDENAECHKLVLTSEYGIETVIFD